MDKETSEVLPSFYEDVDIDNLPVPSTPDEYIRVVRTGFWGETGLEREPIFPTRESEVRKPLKTLNAHHGKKLLRKF